MKNTKFYSRQHIDKKDIDSVVKCLKSDYLTTGPLNKIFENKINKFCNSKYCVPVNSGTSALITALFSMDLKKKDIILIPAVSFIATANCASLLGYKVKFIDVDKENGLINPTTLKKVLKKNNIKVLINVHLNGNVGDLKYIFEICKKNNVKIIEDACHAFGSEINYDKKTYKIGSNRYSDITTFSFHPVKTITTGEGGAVLTNNLKYYNNIKKFISHGMYFKPLEEKKYKWNYYDMDFPGYNFRMSDINCSLGISQIDKTKKFINKRNKIEKFYINYFLKYKNSISIIKINKNVKSSYHLFPIQIDFKKYNINKLEMLNKLLKMNIRCQIHYKPINHNFFYSNNNRLLGSEKYFNNTFSIPIHFNMNLNDAKYVAENIVRIFEKLKNKK